MGVMDGLEPGTECGKTTDGRGGERYLTAGETFQLSQAISLKRIADAFDYEGGKPQGTVLWWLEMIASAANAGRS